MKILLVGEYSGFHNALKEGLLALGHEVVLLAHSDGFKKFESDISWNTNENFIGKARTLYNLNNNIGKLKNFDVVQFINQSVFQEKFNINKKFINRLIENNAKSFLIGAGDDSIVWEYWDDIEKNKLRYSWIKEGRGYEFLKRNEGLNFYEQPKNIQWNNDLARKVDGIIPIMYEYAEPYRRKDFKNLRKTIPIPINTQKIQYRDNIIADKPMILHGLNRYGVKGTNYIEEAFSILAKRYPDKLHLLIKGRLSIEDYLKLIDKVNISIDQTNSYSLAINALTSMAMGKVVLGGVEQESLNELDLLYSPALNIRPDKNLIVETLESFVFDKKFIYDQSIKSREFVECNHDYINVAKMYLKTWNE